MELICYGVPGSLTGLLLIGLSGHEEEVEVFGTAFLLGDAMMSTLLGA